MLLHDDDEHCECGCSEVRETPDVQSVVALLSEQHNPHWTLQAEGCWCGGPVVATGTERACLSVPFHDPDRSPMPAKTTDPLQEAKDLAKYAKGEINDFLELRLQEVDGLPSPVQLTQMAVELAKVQALIAIAEKMPAAAPSWPETV